MARKGKTRIYIEYLAARGIYGFLGILPRPAAVALGIGVGRAGYFLLGRLRRLAFRNLELAMPEKSPAAHEKIVKGTFDNLGRVLGEASHIGSIDREHLQKIVDFKFRDDIMELYRKVKSERRGVLITTGHLGNWELLVQAFAVLYEPISFLARPLDNPLIEEMTLKIRSRFGNRPINKANSAITAISILREGGFLGILSDVNAHPKEGVFVPFFGIPACTTSGPAMMAIRANALIFPAFCIWDRELGRYRFVHGDPIEPADTGDRKLDIIKTTEAYTAEIEKIIRQYPDQWLWIHKRWKTRPPGETQLY